MSFSFYRSLTIDHTLCGAADSSSFPVLVSASHATLKSVANGGNVQSSTAADLLFFADSGGVTQYPSEIEFYDPVNGVVVAWVQVPTVSHTVDTVLYALYGNSSPPSRTTNPWDANHKGVWHLPDGTTLSANDSTASPLNGTITGATAGSGKIDGGGVFDSSGGKYVSLAGSSKINTALDSNVFTVSAWINPTGTTRGIIFGNKGQSHSRNIAMLDSWGTGISITEENVAVITSSGSNLSTNAWHHVAWTQNGTAYVLYVDGALSKSGTYSFAGTYTGGYEFSSSVTAGFDGNLDEIRISNAARSADWITTEYNSQNAPGNIGSAAFLTWGAETSAGGGGGQLFLPAALNGLGVGGPFFQNPLN